MATLVSMVTHLRTMVTHVKRVTRKDGNTCKEVTRVRRVTRKDYFYG